MESQDLSTSFLKINNGPEFQGFSIGDPHEVTALLCFTTTMSGYQEAIYDPSYRDHILVFSFPHIGNTGLNNTDSESFTPSVRGLILGQLPSAPSHPKSCISLTDLLIEHQIPCLAGVDTKNLIALLRSADRPLVGTICSSTKPQKPFSQKWLPNITSTRIDGPTVVVIDFGVKHSILKALQHRGCQTHTVSPGTPIHEIQKLQPCGIVLSNGPGDPSLTPKRVLKMIQSFADYNLPILGICFGHQLIARAFGGTTYRLPLGHHSSNHPVRHLATNHVYSTSQNHDYAVHFPLPDEFVPTFTSLADGSIEGFQSMKKPIFSVQFHPEGAPGPFDTSFLFDTFVNEIRSYATRLKI